ncbi:DUF2089 domain-containing protein [Clostridium butanoliproducens]|uniref:DUF2089 domain-containing protein n=1 Tax=Clostridium butanoliproducens TaxID=2991837 RepID=UPI0024B8F331|nr:DUF2089 domain-containing protein [Clostridium butanoliproducens]
MYKLISKCPVCASNLKITRLKCDRCNTIIENEFELPAMTYLSDEQIYFMEVFLRCRGSIKDVEKELKISYPTVRAKLDDVIEALGYKLSKKSSNNEEILNMLESGEITAEQAIEMLKNK